MGSLLILIGRGEEDDGGGVLLLTDSCGRLLVLGLSTGKSGGELLTPGGSKNGTATIHVKQKEEEKKTDGKELA